MPRAHLVVAGDRRIVHTNAAAGLLLEAIPELRAETGYLLMSEAPGGGLDRAFDAASAVHSPQPSCVLVQADGETRHVLSFLPLAASHVLILGQEVPLSTSVSQRLSRLFSLTRAETEVAIGIAEGRTLRQIAAQRRVAEATAKAQLKALMRKLACRRQAEIVVLVRSLLPVHGYD